jgi:Asp-tRNA(Asn)/Glu-tRNA(Gln) amidotransferase C subunit
MTGPRFNVTPDAVRRYADMFDIALSDAEITEIAGQLAGGFVGIAALWQVDVSDVEPSVIFPIDRM